MPTKLHNKNYTALTGYYQLVLPVNYEVLIPDDDSVRLLSLLLEGLNYEKLYQAYSSIGRKSAVEPKILFKVLTYAYSNNIYSSRKIESACKRVSHSLRSPRSLRFLFRYYNVAACVDFIFEGSVH